MPETDTLLRLRTPADLIAILPYLFGYRLHDSLVVVSIRDGRLGVVQRLDLPGARQGRPLRDALQVLRRVLRRDDPDLVMIVAFESVPGAGGPLRTAASRLCNRHGWPVLAELVVRNDRWWHLDAGDDLRRQGRPLPEDSQVPAVAECVAAGRAPLAGRESVAALLEPTDAAESLTAQLTAARRRRRDGSPRQRFERDANAWRQWLAGDFVASADDSPEATSHRECLASCVLALEDSNVRDALIAWLAPGVLPPAMAPQPAWEVLVDRLGPVPGVTTVEQAPVSADADRGSCAAELPTTAEELRVRGRNRLIDAVRGTPPAQQAPVLTVLGAIAWWQGDGTLAREAIERARRLRPSYTLASLLYEMIRQGVRF